MRPTLTGLAASNAVLLRPGNVHSADGRENVLKPVLARYADRELMRFFRADAAFAVPELYKTPEAEGCSYAARSGKTAVPESRIAPVLKRPAGRSTTHVRRICGDFAYQAASWDKPSWDKSWRVVAEVERHPGDLFPKIGFPKIGFVVTKLPMEPDRIVRFYNQRGTAERHVEKGRQVINRTRLSCKGMARNEVRLQLHASACNPGVFLQGADRPADPPHQDRSAGRPPRLSRHVPTGRGGCRRRSIHPHPCGHPTAPCATGTGQRYLHDGVGDQTRAKAARRV